MKVDIGDYIVAIDLGTNTVVAMIGTKGEDGRIRVIDREVSAVQGAGMIRGEIKNIYRYLLPIIESNDIGWR